MCDRQIDVEFAPYRVVMCASPAVAGSNFCAAHAPGARISTTVFECVDRGPRCRGDVDYQALPSGLASPRCDFHWAERLIRFENESRHAEALDLLRAVGRPGDVLDSTDLLLGLGPSE